MSAKIGTGIFFLFSPKTHYALDKLPKMLYHNQVKKLKKGRSADMHEIFHEIFLHGILDVLPIIPFLFLAYLLMEFIEHKASDKTTAFLKKSGPFGPLIGGALGIVPQCGLSSVASNLYCGRIITPGTLIAVFLSCSDEMLPILISSSIVPKTVIGILIFKLASAILVGFLVDLVLRFVKMPKRDIDIDELCEKDRCHCERGIFFSALHHTVSITLFILLFTFAVNALIFFIGEESLSMIMYDKPFISHIIAAVFGLIPNCASSVALTTFYTDGLITLGTMLSGLFAGSGVGLLVLFRVNRHLKENLLIVLVLVLSGFALGLLCDLTGLSALIS